MMRKVFIFLSLIGFYLVNPLFSESLTREAVKKPNILWIYLEDVSRWFGCYGDSLAHTPNVDQLAREGTKFNRFYTPAGVCSSTRSAVITGMMQTSIGAHHHRSNRGHNIEGYIDSHDLPKGMKTIPEYFKSQGYYTFNDGKDDFNFNWKKANLYDDYGSMNFQGDEWSKVPKGKPFFGQIQIWGGKDKKGVAANITDDQKTDRSKVSVPPYYPDLPEVREEIAHHYDCIRWLDVQVGRIIAKLKEDGLYDNTIICLLSDHGFKLHRDKQYLYEGGIKMPLIISGPGIEKNRVNHELISGIDLGPTSLGLAGLNIPEHMEGQNIYASNYKARDFVVSAKDRCGITIDRVRAIVTPNFKYMKNFMTEKSFMQPTYKDGWPVTKAIRKWIGLGQFTDAQKTFFGKIRPAEELYDLENDPNETNNLAKNPEYAEVLKKHRTILETWMLETKDAGQHPEKPAGLLAVLYDYGKKAVNPEYEAVKKLVKPESLRKKRTARRK
jgi:arylsulfatase A-like enzyme